MRQSLKILVGLALVLGMIGTVSASTDIDSFEDGDFTNNPKWYLTASSNTQISTNTVKDGGYSVNVIHSGTDFIFGHNRTTSAGQSIQDGDTYSVWAHPVEEAFYLFFVGDTGGTGSFPELSSGDHVQFGFESDNQFRFRTYDDSGNQIYSESLGSYSNSSWYRFEVVFDTVNSEVDFKVYDSTGSLLYSRTDKSYSGDTSYKYVGVNNNGNSGDNIFVDQFTYSHTNNPPQFNSTSVSPDPPEIGNNVSYSAEVYDSDGSISHTNLTVTYGGSTVVSDDKKTGTTPSWPDIYKPSTGDKWLNATFEAVDDAGAVTTATLNRYLADTAPTVSVSSPNNSTYYKYDVGYTVATSDDGDSNPGESLDCTVKRGTTTLDTVSLTEGQGASGTTSQDKGTYKLEGSCTESDDNQTSSDHVYFTVERYSLVSNSTASSVYETENTTYNIDVKAGNMVNSVETVLYWDGQERNTLNKDNSGTTTHQFDHFFRPLLVSSNGASKNWYFNYSVNYTKFGGGYASSSRKSTTGSQTINWAFTGPQASPNDTKLVEKQDFETTLSWTTNGNPDPDVTKNCKQTFNGSTKGSSCTETFDTPLAGANNYITENLTGQLDLSYKSSSRSMNIPEEKITVYRKILTDCNNAKYGVTGVTALSFKMYNEENRSQTPKGNIDYNFDTTHHGEHTRNYAFANSGVQQSDVCVYPDWAEYEVTGPIQYSSKSDQNKYNTTFPDRQYRLFGEKINNASETIDLYLLPESVATPVYFKVVDQAGEGVPDVTVKVMRYFIGTDSYLTVAKAQTDSEGLATTYMHVNEITYKYILTKDGKVLKSTGKEILACQSTPCTKKFQLSTQKRSPYFIKKEGFSTKVEKVKDSNGNVTGLQATVNHDSGSIEYARFIVKEKQVVGWNTLCNITTSSTGQSMVCSFNKTAQNSLFQYKVLGAKDGNVYRLVAGHLDNTKGIFGADNPVAAFVVFLLFASFGLVNPKLAVAFSTAGVLVTIMMGLITISIGAAASLVILAAAVVIAGET